MRTVILSMAVLLGLLSSGIAAGQELLVGLTYTCNGERMFVEFCPSNPSDDAKCMVGHPDRPEHNGMTDLYPRNSRLAEKAHRDLQAAFPGGDREIEGHGEKGPIV